jgi:hypothetical protein
MEEGGSEIPRTVSEKGSLYPPGIPSTRCLSSCEEIELSLTRSACRPLMTPTFVCFLLRTLDRGLSIVDADDPDAREGVRILAGTSSFGSRDVEPGCVGLCGAMLGF